jgi:hypothetical protein
MLCSPAWDRDAVRDDVRDYVVEAIGDPAGVLIAEPPPSTGQPHRRLITLSVLDR